MPTREAFSWFKQNFHREINAAVAGTPFSLDLAAAIAAQETGHIWAPLRNKLSLERLLEICVGDTLDVPNRKAFPTTKEVLVAAPRGQEMFEIARLAQGQQVQPRLASNIEEQRANDLFRWLRAFGPQFGWRQTSTLTKLQTEVNAGAVGLIVARRKLDGKSGHIVMVAPETDQQTAKRDPATGQVVSALQSEAGRRNVRLGPGRRDWFKDEEFADSAFWIHT